MTDLIANFESGASVRDKLNRLPFGGYPLIGKTDKSEDVADKAQAILDAGYDLMFPPGDYRLGHRLETKFDGQSIRTAPGAALYPNFDGNVISVTKTFNKISVRIIGTDQPGTGVKEGAIIIGWSADPTTPTDARRACLSGSYITSRYGHGVEYWDGAYGDFSQCWVSDITEHGFVLGNTFGHDANHGIFEGAQATRCAKIGFWVRKKNTSNTTVETADSRLHNLNNAKAFNCGQNYLIETEANFGLIFSEWSSDFDPAKKIAEDTFGPSSWKNNIGYAGDVTKFSAMLDLGIGNEIEGPSTTNGSWWTRVKKVGRLIIQNGFSGNRQVYQSGNYTYRDEVTGSTDGTVLYTHDTTPARRTDEFAGKVKFAAGSEIQALTVYGTLAGQVTVPDGAVASGAKVEVVATCNLNSKWVVFASPQSGSDYVLQYFRLRNYVGPDGDIRFILENADTSSQTLAGVTINYSAFKVAP